ncbi:FAD:protein FMN transferase [Paenibacillus sp. CAA11]|uniref:FAD:protein FMN transferase n=1 Tax=Paenibacillus sp. CAA11 TaxID=1532905 RepID=UPI000D3C82E3|nr:FAD:protein FMN transferase [Paenibacillus sp. CAA11]AWB44483.1 FAD:protein FMN transferase [Paenibacillus sp. CAA11]
MAIRFNAMNTDIALYGTDETAGLRARSWFSFVENTLSRFKEDSELTKLNRAGGRIYLASPLLYKVAETADYYFRQTSGLFNPYLGANLSGWGYSASFEKLGELSRPKPFVPSITPKNELEPAIFNPGQRSIQLQPQIQIDLGGIAKGWSAHKLSEMLKKEGWDSGLIDAGGDIASWSSGGGVREIAVAHPLKADLDIAVLKLNRSAGIATSSTQKRRWLDQTGRELHHLLDPRTGMPSKSDLIQVTVVARSLLIAEVYAKCLLILGTAGSRELLNHQLTDLGMIAVTQSGEILVHGNVEGELCKGRASL